MTYSYVVSSNIIIMFGELRLSEAVRRVSSDTRACLIAFIRRYMHDVIHVSLKSMSGEKRLSDARASQPAQPRLSEAQAR